MCRRCRQWNVTRPLPLCPASLSLTASLQNNELQSCCWGAWNIAYPMDRGEHISDNAPALVMSCEMSKKALVTEPFYYQALFTEAGAWIWHKALLFEASSLLALQQTVRILEVKESESREHEWGACGVMYQNARMMSSAWLVVNTLSQSMAISSKHSESSVGKRQAPVWEMALLFTQSWWSAVCYHLWCKSSGWLGYMQKERVFVRGLDPMSPMWQMSQAFEDAS